MNKLSRREREKSRREKEIIDAAEKIFARDGYAHASMNEISREAEFSKRTLYQYFENKSDLYLSCTLRLYKSMLEHIKNLSFYETTGYGRVKEVFEGYYTFYKNNESVFRIIYDFGKIRHETTNPKIKEFLKLDEALAMNLRNLIILGQEDGSISKELNPTLTTRTLLFLMVGFFNQLTVTGNTYTSHIDTDIDVFSSYALNLLHSTLK